MKTLIIACALAVPQLALASGSIPEGWPAVIGNDPRGSGAHVVPQPAGGPPTEEMAAPPAAMDFTAVPQARKDGDGKAPTLKLIFSFLRLVGGFGGLDIGFGMGIRGGSGDPGFGMWLDYMRGIQASLSVDDPSPTAFGKIQHDAEFSMFHTGYTLDVNVDSDDVTLTGGAGLAMGVLWGASDPVSGDSLDGAPVLALGLATHAGALYNIGGVGLGGQLRFNKYFMGGFSVMSLDFVAAF
ncbi:MAG: hypothetical protein HY903_22940 [Deltaproteobacteria bacterium]|nr:hypothetical protein [Deltaproteobacteria bacterium]